jgi:hypothetical protein
MHADVILADGTAIPRATQKPAERIEAEQFTNRINPSCDNTYAHANGAPSVTREAAQLSDASYFVAISLKNEIPGEALFKSEVRTWNGAIHTAAKISHKTSSFGRKIPCFYWGRSSKANPPLCKSKPWRLDKV